MWGSFQKLASKALSALPSKEELLREVEKVKVFGDLDSLKDSPEQQAADQRRQHARDLGITFATDRLLLMGRPHAASTRAGRVNLDSVATFFHDHFQGKFMVWNLSKYTYDYGRLDDQVIAYDIKSHPVPPLGLLVKVCMSIHSWLKEDPSNVAAIHCRDGRVCTTAVAACYLAWSAQFSDTGRAFAHICERRAQSARRLSTAAELAVPSSHRYMRYFNSILSGVRPSGNMLILNRIIVHGLPALDGDGSTTLNVTVHKSGTKLYDHELLADVSDADNAVGDAFGATALPKHLAKEGALKFDVRVPLQGDIVVEFWHVPRTAASGGDVTGETPTVAPRVIFSCAFHTGYVVDNVLSLPREELDMFRNAVDAAVAGSAGGQGSSVAKGELSTRSASEVDSRFGEDFALDLIFSSVEDSRAQLRRISTGTPRTEGSVEVQAMDLSAFESMIGEHSNFWDEIPKRRADCASTSPEREASKQPDDTHLKLGPTQLEDANLANQTPKVQRRQAEIHIEDSMFSDSSEPEDNDEGATLVDPPSADSDNCSVEDKLSDTDNTTPSDGPRASTTDDVAVARQHGSATVADQPRSQRDVDELDISPIRMPTSIDGSNDEHINTNESQTATTGYGEHGVAPKTPIPANVAAADATNGDDSPFDLEGMNAELAALGLDIGMDSTAEGDSPNLAKSLHGVDTDEVFVTVEEAAAAAAQEGEEHGDEDDDDDFEDLENYLATLES